MVYDLIRDQDPELASELHDSGWQGSSLRPLGVSPPVFAGAGRSTKAYATSSQGAVWLGSPVPAIAASMLAGVAGKQDVRWGATTLRVRGIAVEATPDHGSGEAVFSTVSPVLVKDEGRFLLPDDPPFREHLVRNLRHKADVLGLPNDVEMEVLDAGPRRLFRVQKAPKVGAVIRARLTGAPALLDALADWGLGLCTNQGFGWVR